MGRFFSYDSKLMQFLGKITDCIILNMVWLICCIPIVTIGASTTAFYYTITKAIRNERGYVLPEFWRSFKSNFKQSTLVWLIMLFITIFAYFDIYYAYVLSTAGVIPKILLWFVLILFVLVAMWMSYFFPYIARFTNTTRQILRNSAIIMIRNIFWSLQNVVILVATIVLILMIPFLVFLLPAFCTVLTSMSLEKVFRKYMSPEDKKMEDERNGNYYE